MLWYCCFTSVVKNVFEYVLMLLRLIIMFWIVCLFHHFSLIVPAKNSKTVVLLSSLHA